MDAQQIAEQVEVGKIARAAERKASESAKEMERWESLFKEDPTAALNSVERTMSATAMHTASLNVLRRVQNVIAFPEHGNTLVGVKEGLTTRLIGMASNTGINRGNMTSYEVTALAWCLASWFEEVK